MAFPMGFGEFIAICYFHPLVGLTFTLVFGATAGILSYYANTKEPHICLPISNIPTPLKIHKKTVNTENMLELRNI